ncbi:IS3 family transposase [Vibrio sp. FF145]|uniref:IS3 family transposase n=1 Tax=Vibrio sp. FF145 TaxID=3230013 RepID=UPI00352DA68D
MKHLLHTLQLAKSVFYYQAQTSKRPNSYERELQLIKSIYHEHKGRYGYRRIHLELKNQVHRGFPGKAAFIFKKK